MLSRSEDSVYIKFLENALIKEVSSKVHDKIIELVDPVVQDIVREATIEAVKDWSVKYRDEVRPEDFGMVKHINLAFVENVIRTEFKENDIKITVKDKEK